MPGEKFQTFIKLFHHVSPTKRKELKTFLVSIFRIKFIIDYLFRFMTGANLFVIPEGDPSEQISRYERLMRAAMVEAGAKRRDFIEYKRACRRFHIKSVETEEMRALLSQVIPGKTRK